MYCASPRVADARDRLGPVATVVDAGDNVEMRMLSTDLSARGVDRLLVEGGGTVPRNSSPTTSSTSCS